MEESEPATINLGCVIFLPNGSRPVQVGGPADLVCEEIDRHPELIEMLQSGIENARLPAEALRFMPVLNVPFRLIAAWNPQRAGVLDNQLQPQKAFTFRFAVGSTF